MRHGILLINKPAGITSHDVVQNVRKTLHERNIGHLGTLDPAATGLLVLFVGKKALKVLELFQSSSKEYVANVCCGTVSSTYDQEGVMEKVPEKLGWSIPTEVQLMELLRTHFSGTITQKPPAYSAVHIHGKRAYELIRKNPNMKINMPEREVVISDIQLVAYEYPNITLCISCSTGTYIRSIAHDLGKELHCGAYLKSLRRTRVDAWNVKDAHVPENITWGHILPLKDILTMFPRYDLTEDEWSDIRHGRSVAQTFTEEPLIAWHENLPVAILQAKDGKTHPRKVL